MQPEILFYIIVLIYSIVIHEIAHGYVAYLFGDNTALYQNRLTLNPVPHVDPIGSIFLPALLVLSGSPILAGWAKPVPVSEHNLNPYKLGKFSVAIAGVAVNLLLAITFVIIGSQMENEYIKSLCSIIALTNTGLAIFNLIPFPPADGFRILELFLPWNVKQKIDTWLHQYFLIVMLGMLFFASFVFRIIFPFFQKLIYSIIF